ncbi:hypothetical protein TURU_054209 [Turdus rufiventris]|nr:hypothetical protein TURU_054209 [Turdus rufiventris]
MSSIKSKFMTGELASHGLDKYILHWVINCLNGQAWRMMANELHPVGVLVTSGTLWNSVFGPDLFCIFIDNLEESIEYPLSQFAHETKVDGRVDLLEGRKALQKPIVWAETQKCQVLDPVLLSQQSQHVVLQSCGRMAVKTPIRRGPGDAS